MPQTYDDILNNYKCVLDFICPNGSKDEITKARMLLGNMMQRLCPHGPILKVLHGIEQNRKTRIGIVSSQMNT